MKFDVISFGIGMVSSSVIFGVALAANTRSGILHIDHSNPEKDTYLFELDSLEGLDKKKRIVLKIDNKADLSQK